METEEDLDGVNLHLQGAGQVHHLIQTQTQLLLKCLKLQVRLRLDRLTWRCYLAFERRLTVHHAVPGQQLVPGLGRHQHKVLVLHQTLLQVIRVQI